MPSRGSALEVAVARTTFSPNRTTTDPPACFASLPVSKDMVLPPLRLTVTVVGSGFIDFPSERMNCQPRALSFVFRAESEPPQARKHRSRRLDKDRLRLRNARVEISSMLAVSPETAFQKSPGIQSLMAGKSRSSRFHSSSRKDETLRASKISGCLPLSNAMNKEGPQAKSLLADAEFADDRLVTLGIVFLQIVQQATALADQHEKPAARAVVFLVRLEVLRQLANPLAEQGDLNFGTTRITRMRAVLVNEGFLLLSG